MWDLGAPSTDNNFVVCCLYSYTKLRQTFVDNLVIMDLLFVGHSYVRRLRDHYLQRPDRHRPYTHVRRHPRPDQRNVRPYQSRGTATLCRNINLDVNFNAAYTVGDDIVFVCDLPISHRDVRSVRPAVVMVDIGSNDIASLTAVYHGAMLRLAMDVHSFALSLDVAMVVLNTVLPQTDRLACSPETFLANAKSYNKILLNLAGSGGVPIVWFSTRWGDSSARSRGQVSCQIRHGLVMASTPIGWTAWGVTATASDSASSRICTGFSACNCCWGEYRVSTARVGSPAVC